MILYKYLSFENALRVISGKKSRFTPPCQLNDPFELRPFYESLNEAPEVQEQLTDENLRKVMQEQMDKAMDQMPQELFQYLPKEFIQNLFGDISPATIDITPELFDGLTRVFGESIYQSLNRLVGILCVSERNDIPLMWAHYASGHSGVVLGFDSENEFFERRLSAQDNFRHLEKITYSADACVQIVQMEDGREILYTKTTDWEYEQEWRIVLPLQDADEVIQIDEVTIHLFQFPSAALREVVLGRNVSDDHRNEIHTILETEAEYAHIRRFSAELDERYRTITVKEFAT